MQKTLTAFQRHLPSTQARRDVSPGALVGLASFAAMALFLGLASGAFSADEGWFLQVSRRMLQGEILYRDVFFGVTPLSIYLFNILAMVLGVEAVVMKALQALLVVLTLVISRRLARQLDLPGYSIAALSMSLLIYTPPGMVSAGGLYVPLSVLFMLITFSAALHWQQHVTDVHGDGQPDGGRYLAIGGSTAALCFASKQNTGLYVFTWFVLMVIMVKAWRQGHRLRLAPLLIPCAAFLLVTALILLPVALGGGAEKFLDYGFLNKGQYVRSGYISYVDGFWQQYGQYVANNQSGLRGYLDFVRGLSLYLLPPLAFLALLAAWFQTRSARRRLVMAVFSFVAVAVATVYPRMDIDHLAPIAAPLMLGVMFGARQIRFAVSDDRRLAARRILLTLGIVLLSHVVSKPLGAIARGDYELSTLPHAAGIFIDTGEQRAIRENAAHLHETAGRDRVFLLFWEAGTYYLIAGTQNPTPFDYPLKPAFGLTGEQDTVTAIERGHIDAVCWRPLGTHPMSPTLLEAFVQKNMRPGRDLGFCRLYQFQP